MKIRRKNQAKKSGRRVGQMRPFTHAHIERLESFLRADSSSTSIRDLALLRVGIDTMLRSVDLVSLTIDDVTRNGEVIADFTTKQRKTRKAVSCTMLPETQKVLAEWLAHAEITKPDAKVFAISTRQHQRIIKQWCDALGIDGTMYSTHSIRRTKPTAIYAKTKNLEVVRQLLGHSNFGATQHYLGIDKEDALDVARKFKI